MIYGKVLCKFCKLEINYENMNIILKIHTLKRMSNLNIMKIIFKLNENTRLKHENVSISVLKTITKIIMSKLNMNYENISLNHMNYEDMKKYMFETLFIKKKIKFKHEL